MREKLNINISGITNFKEKLQYWASHFDPVIILDSNLNTKNERQKNWFSNYDLIIATGSKTKLKLNAGSAYSNLQKLIESSGDWLFGYLSYDLKNELERLTSTNYDGLNFPDTFFFQPELVFTLIENKLTVYYYKTDFTHDQINNVLHEISDQPKTTTHIEQVKPDISPRISKSEYLEKLSSVINHIQRGDIYELNLCMEFFASGVELNPFTTWRELKRISPAPFSTYLSAQEINLLSASPERFIKKSGTRIISQPIKGTIRRGFSLDEDIQLKNQLKNDPKERAENVMIVDLVRNDLSRTALRNSVKVDELCGIYTFEQVHQMISSISAEVSPQTKLTDIIKQAFPMGSMTGAPKIRAMELIEEYEESKRGLYSGAVGYFTPDGNFDFNVVIRSILYNSSSKYLSYSVGGAITSKSKAENEYQECLLKAQAMQKALNIE